MKTRALSTLLGRGTALKLGADLLGRLLQYALLLLAARRLGSADFGDYSFALSIGYMLAQIADFGLQLYVQRELARLAYPNASERPYFSDEAAAGRLIGGGLLLKAILSVPALALLAILIAVEPVGNRAALLAVGLAMVLATFLEYFSYCFRALRRLGDEAMAIVLARGANLMLGALALLLGSGVWGLALTGNLALLVGLGFAYLRLRGYVTPRFSPDWAYWRRQMGQPAALGIGIIFSMIASKADNLIIPPLLGREALGVYNVAYKLYEPTQILPALVLAATFPLLAQAGVAVGRDQMRRTLGATLLVLGGLGALVVAALGMLAGPLVWLLYGGAFVAAGEVLALLALAVLPMFLNYGLTHALIAVDRTNSYALFMLLALVANVGANLLLIPALGIGGAALATAVTEWLLLAFCGAAVWRMLGGWRTAMPQIEVAP